MAEPSKVNGQVSSPPLAVNHHKVLTEFQINSAIGTAKEAVGAAIETAYQAVGGSTEPSSFSTAGREQHAKGEAEVKAAETKQYAEG